jgi:hypothetical protein
MTIVNLNRTDSDTNWVYYSRKDHRGIMREILSLVDLTGKFLFIIDSFNFRDLHDGKQQPFNVYPDIFEYKKRAEENALQFIIIFEMVYEAPNYKDLQIQIEDVSQKLNIPTQDMIIFSGALEQDNTKIKNALCTKVLSQNGMFHGTAADLLPTHHYVSLVRGVRSHRLAATIEILERDIEHLGKLSMGCGYYTRPEEHDYSFLPEKYQKKFPMFIDGLILGQEQYRGEPPEITNAFANLVHETSFDESYNFMTFHTIVWHQPFITEKSIKPFAWGQVPIFITVKNHDIYMREFGFDLFDDIIDHSYNQENNPEKRITLAIDQLEKLCVKPIEYWQKYKSENIERFIKNRELSQITVNQTTHASARNLQKVLDTY